MLEKVKEKEAIYTQTILFLIQYLVEHKGFVSIFIKSNIYFIKSNSSTFKKNVERTWIANPYKVTHQKARYDFLPLFYDLFLIINEMEK